MVDFHGTLSGIDVAGIRLLRVSAIFRTYNQCILPVDYLEMNVMCWMILFRSLEGGKKGHQVDGTSSKPRPTVDTTLTRTNATRVELRHGRVIDVAWHCASATTCYALYDKSVRLTQC